MADARRSASKDPGTSAGAAAFREIDRIFSRRYGKTWRRRRSAARVEFWVRVLETMPEERVRWALAQLHRSTDTAPPSPQAFVVLSLQPLPGTSPPPDVAPWPPESREVGRQALADWKRSRGDA